MTTYRVNVRSTSKEPSFCVYSGGSIDLALDRAGQYEWAEIVIVEYKHADGSWRVVTSREGVNDVDYETAGVPRELGSPWHDSRLGY